jgi:hypothetical protein
MAVTFTPTLTLSSTTTGTDALSFSVTKNITLGDNDVRVTRTFSPGEYGSSAGVQIFDTNLGKSYIYVKNIHGATTIHLGPANNSNTNNATWMELAPGEFAFFPWAGYADIFALVASGTATAGLEVTIFEA